jgi:hypothetical protein
MASLTTNQMVTAGFRNSEGSSFQILLRLPRPFLLVAAVKGRCPFDRALNLGEGVLCRLSVAHLPQQQGAPNLRFLAAEIVRQRFIFTHRVGIARLALQ